MWPASERFDATGTGFPSEPYWNEIGPALKLASQIMISFTFEPPEVLDVKRSYATSATIVPDVVCDHCQVDCRLDKGVSYKRIDGGKSKDKGRTKMTS